MASSVNLRRTTFSGFRTLSDERRKKKVYFPVHIMREILEKVDIKTLFRFKAVSQLYNAIISHPNWAYMYLTKAYCSGRRRHRSGLTTSLMYPLTNQNAAAAEDKILMQDEEEPHKSICISYVTLPKRPHKILGSSRGLVLSLYLHPGDATRFGLCVSNPLTHKSVDIPELPEESLPADNWLFGFVATPVYSPLVYKIVLIAKPLPRNVIFENASVITTTRIFSSDTGSWATWQDVTGPTDLFINSTGRAGIPNIGILHWPGFIRCDAIITYDPFNCPEKFGRIPLPAQKIVIPEGDARACQCIIYSAEYRPLQFAQFDNETLDNETRYFVWWKLVDYAKKEWRRQVRVCEISGMPYLCNKLVVAPNPFDSRLYCHPFVIGNKVTIFDCKLGQMTSTSKVVDMSMETPQKGNYSNRLILVDYCPWSSPSSYVPPPQP